MLLQLSKCFVDLMVISFCLLVVGCHHQKSGDLDNDMQWRDIRSKVQTALASNCCRATAFSIKELLLTLQVLTLLQEFVLSLHVFVLSAIFKCLG